MKRNPWVADLKQDNAWLKSLTQALNEESWWDQADDRPVKTMMVNDHFSELEDRSAQEVWSAVKRFWCAQPLVWRRQGQEVQAVLSGMLRWTWSTDNPSGRWEVFDVWAGWRLASSKEAERWTPEQWWRKTSNDDSFGSWWPMCAQAMARYARQKEAPRRVWRMDESWSWWPSRIGEDELSDEDLDLGKRAHGHELRRLARELIRLDPVWKPLIQAMHRQPDRAPILLREVAKRWTDWRTALAEHPRAGLMLGWAVDQGWVPDRHLWRTDRWQAAYPQTTAAGWNAVRSEPWSRVKALTRTSNALGVAALALLRTWPVDHVPAAVWRAIPSIVWHRALTVWRPDHRNTWSAPEVKIVRAFVDAAKARKWTADDMSLSRWLEEARHVWAWVAQKNVPAFSDPSWSWASVAQRWSETNQERADLPFCSLVRQNVQITVVPPGTAWTIMGRRFKNCLRDPFMLERDHRLARCRRSVLVHFKTLSVGSSRSTTSRSQESLGLITCGGDQDAAYGWWWKDSSGVANGRVPENHAAVARWLKQAMSRTFTTRNDEDHMIERDWEEAVNPLWWGDEGKTPPPVIEPSPYVTTMTGMPGLSWLSRQGWAAWMANDAWWSLQAWRWRWQQRPYLHGVVLGLMIVLVSWGVVSWAF